MSAPYDPYRREGEQSPPAQQPPGQQQPYGGPPQYGGGPPYGDRGGFSYTPYGSPYPAGTGDDEPPPVRRPGLMVGALVMLILSALPFLVFGALLGSAPLNTGAIPQTVLDQLAGSGVSAEQILSLLRGIAWAMAVIALLYCLFAVLAFVGKNWARILVAVMTAGFTLLLLFGMFGGGAATDTATLGFALAVLALSIGGTVLMFLAPSSRWFSALR